LLTLLLNNDTKYYLIRPSMENEPGKRLILSVILFFASCLSIMWSSDALFWVLLILFPVSGLLGISSVTIGYKYIRQNIGNRVKNKRVVLFGSIMIGIYTAVIVLFIIAIHKIQC
jgi:MFS family permease